MLNVIVLISGSGSNLKALLEASREPESPFRITGVAADVEASGLEHAHKFDVPTTVVSPKNYDSRSEWGKAFGNALEAFGAHPEASEPWLVVSAGLMRILPANFVTRFSPHLINTHPALLPKYPGAHAVRDALADGAVETGCTVHIIDEGVDTGPVIAQESVHVLPDDTEAELHERIKAIERPLLVSVVSKVATGTLNLHEIASAHHDRTP